MQVTLQLLQHVFTDKKTDFLTQLITPINNTITKYNIQSKARVSAFIAQTSVESWEFSHFEEDLNYSALQLQNTFPKFFPTITIANQYAHQPEKIANKVYANRYLNGDEASGDGWKYRGRGFIQITFKYNYQQVALAFKKTVEDTINYMETFAGAFDCAGWFWNKHNLNTYADQNRLNTITKIINGGLTDAEVRLNLYNKILAFL